MEVIKDQILLIASGKEPPLLDQAEDPLLQAQRNVERPESIPLEQGPVLRKIPETEATLPVDQSSAENSEPQRTNQRTQEREQEVLPSEQAAFNAGPGQPFLEVTLKHPHVVPFKRDPQHESLRELLSSHLMGKEEKTISFELVTSSNLDTYTLRGEAKTAHWSVRRTIPDFNKFFELLLYRNPYLLIPFQRTRQEEVFDEPDFSTPSALAIVESRRHVILTNLRHVLDHPELRESPRVRSFLTVSDWDVPDSALHSSEFDLEIMKLKTEKAMGMLPSLPERQEEDKTWSVIRSRFALLKSNLDAVRATLQRLLRARGEMQRGNMALCDSMQRLQDLQLVTDSRPIADERRTLQQSATAFASLAALDQDQISTGETALLDTLQEYEYLDEAFKRADAYRDKLMLYVEGIEKPLKDTEQSLKDVLATGSAGLVSDMKEAVLAAVKGPEAAEKDLADKELELEQKRSSLLGEEEGRIYLYDLFCSKLAREVVQVDARKAVVLSEAITTYLDNLASFHRRSLRAIDSCCHADLLQQLLISQPSPEPNL